MINRLIKTIIAIIVYALAIHVISTQAPTLGLTIQIESMLSYPLALLASGAALWITRHIIKRVVSVVTSPISFITFGLASIIVNFFLIYIFAFLVNYADSGVVINLGTIVQTFKLSILLSLLSFSMRVIL